MTLQCSAKFREEDDRKDFIAELQRRGLPILERGNKVVVSYQTNSFLDGMTVISLFEGLDAEVDMSYWG